MRLSARNRRSILNLCTSALLIREIFASKEVIEPQMSTPSML